MEREEGGDFGTLGFFTSKDVRRTYEALWIVCLDEIIGVKKRILFILETIVLRWKIVLALRVE